MKTQLTVTLKSNLRSAANIATAVGNIADNGTSEGAMILDHLSTVADHMETLANELEDLQLHAILAKMDVMEQMLTIDTAWEGTGFDAQQVNGFNSLLVTAKTFLK